MTALVLGLAAAPVLFVASSGSDQAAGTEKRPLRTLEVAIARHPGRIVLEPGDYAVMKTIELTAADSGLTIVAQRPGTVRLLGGQILRDWSPTDDPRLDAAARPHVRVCDLGGISDLGQMSRAGFSVKRAAAGLELFFEGQPMTLARWPNQGWLRTGAGTKDPVVAFDGDRPARWRSKEDVWAMGYWQYDWAESYERLATAEAGHFTLEGKPPFGVGAGRRFFFLNAIEELDSPGEWYLDRPKHRLYFWPPSAKGEAVVSVLNGTMFHVGGASNVTLRGLDLEAGRGSAIRIEGGEGDRVEGCLIRNFGLDGISIENSTNSGVTGCDLTGLGDRAIGLSGGDRKTLTAGGLYAEDNHIWAYSRWSKTYQPAIGIDGVGNRAVRNLIHDAPHNAILASGNDHLLEGNEVFRVCTETGDAGAFYLGRNPTMRGTMIRGNHFHDLGQKVSTDGNFTEVMSVYLDDCLPGTTISGNVFEGPGTGIMLGGGQDNVVEGNVFVGKNPAVHLDARGRGWAKDKVLNPAEWNFLGLIAAVDGSHGVYAARYPRLADVLSRGFGDPTGTRIADNVSVGGTWLRLQDVLTEKDFDNVGNVQLAVGTLADGLKRRPIDLGKIGLRTKKRPLDLALGR